LIIRSITPLFDSNLVECIFPESNKFFVNDAKVVDEEFAIDAEDDEVDDDKPFKACDTRSSILRLVIFIIYCY
jgi:hypothetical protein